MKEKGKLATDDRTVWWELTYLVGLMYWSVTLQTVIPPAFNTFSTFSLLVVLVMAEMSRTTQSDIFSSSFGFFSVWKSGGRWQGSRCSCLYRWHTRGLGQILSRKIATCVIYVDEVWESYLESVYEGGLSSEQCSAMEMDGKMESRSDGGTSDGKQRLLSK